jgi:GntR family transcriptional regulator
MSLSVDTLFSKRIREGLHKDSPTPLYHQLYCLLKGLILDGTLPHTQRMPTEEQLAQAFLVSRITAKRAMDELASENLVERRRGRGTHVIYKYRPKPVQAPLTGMLQEIESMARNSTANVLECEMMQPPQNIRDEFHLELGDTALHLVRVREREGHNFGYYVSWTNGVKKPSNPKLFEDTPRLSYFRENGLEITHVTQTLSAIAANEEVAKALEITVGSPLLSLIRRSYNKIGNAENMMDYLHVLYHPDRFQYSMDLKLH